jgi:hypothetical protein
MNGDVEELRQKYLFDLAHLCHVTPREVDRMRLLDFFQLILDIDQYRAEMKKRNDQMNAG